MAPESFHEEVADRLFVVDAAQRFGQQAALALADLDVAHDLLEVAPAGTDKGTGLRKVCEVVGIDRDECLVFGDYDNDIPAFDVAGMSVR